MNHTPDWIPSHVEITIHQARELLLKNKNANSELYVSIQVEKEKYTTSFIQRDTAPQWNFVSEIPLMSLDTTIHLTVRQKGRLGDQFIGQIPILLRNFSITPKQITHWYKLGSRPGKVKNKLRGDLQVSIRFLSNWSSPSFGNGKHRLKEKQEEGEVGVVCSPIGDHLSNGIRSGSVGSVSGSGVNKPPSSRRMLSRSKSEMRGKVRDVTAMNVVDGKPATPPQPRVKDRLTTAIRRSFRRKNKTPSVFQECDDDFTFSQSASSTPVLRKRSNTLSSLMKGAHSDDDSLTPSDVSQSSLATVHPSIRVQSSSARESESSGDNTEEGSTTTPVVERRLRDRKSEWVRGSKRRWTMNTLPLLTTPTSAAGVPFGLSPTPSPSSIPTDSGRLPAEEGATPTSTDVDVDGILTYRAKTNSIGISPHPLRRSSEHPRSYSVTSSQGSVRSALLVEQESINENRSGATSPLASSKRSLRDHIGTNNGESGYNTGTSCLEAKPTLRQTSVDDESGSEIGSKSLEKPSQSSTTTPTTPNGTTSGKASTTTTPTKRPRPITRRNTCAAVSRPRGSSQTRPRLESSGGAASSNGGGRGTGNLSTGEKSPPEYGSNVQKKKALSPPATPSRRLLPATPVRRSEKAHLAATRPKSMVLTERSSAGGRDTAEGGHDMVTKDTPSKESTPMSRSKDDQLVKTNDRGSPIIPAEHGDNASTPPGLKSDGTSHEGSGGETTSPSRTSPSSVTTTPTATPTSLLERKTKHTVAYKDSSPLYKGGFQPVSVLPPSMSDYQSQTLPLRGKLARRRSTDTNLTTKQDTAERDLNLLRADSTHRIDRSPPNTKLVHRSSMNYVMGGAQTKTPPPLSVVPASSLSPTSGLDDTDGATALGGGGEVATGEGCSRSSITSFSSTSTSSRPTTPSAKTPGEIVTSALRNRSRPPAGGLRKAIGMYQENRRQVRRGFQFQDNRRPNSFMEELEEVEDMENKKLLEPEREKERGSASAGNSPQLRRNRSAAETLTGLLKNPFNSLRRSKSNLSGSNSHSPSSRPVSMLEEGGDLGISPDLLERLRSSQYSRSHMSLNVEEPSSSSRHYEQKTSAPALMALRCKAATTTASSVKTTPWSTSLEHNSNYNSKGNEPIIRVRTPSITESSSVKTLTELDSSLRESVGSPNSDGANSMTITHGGHSRHTTCSSVDSEGFVSVTSEELNVEELSQHQDLSQLSKEDLFKELVMTRQALKRKDQELKDIKGYLDNLLLRIMDSNPSLLSSPTP